jgi:hypothetical protein
MKGQVVDDVVDQRQDLALTVSDFRSPFYAVTPRASLRDQAVFRCASLVALCDFQLPPLRRAANL